MIMKLICILKALFNHHRHCCVETEQERLTIPCEGFSVEVYIVTSCGCGSCDGPSIDYRGLVRNLNGVNRRYEKDISNGTFDLI